MNRDEFAQQSLASQANVMRKLIKEMLPETDNQPSSKEADHAPIAE